MSCTSCVTDAANRLQELFGAPLGPQQRMDLGTVIHAARRSVVDRPKIEAEALRSAATSGLFGTNAQTTLLNRARAIERGESV